MTWTVNRRQLSAFALAAFTTGDAATCYGAEPPLQPPFDRVVPTETTGFADSSKLADPIVELDNRSRYDPQDPSRSTVDPEREREYERSVKPLREYCEGVVKLANRFTASGGKDLKSAGRVAGELKAWADAKALSRIGSEAAQLNRATAVSALGLAYLQVSPAFDADNPDRRDVERWLRDTGYSIRADYSRGDLKRTSRFNNHRYWAGLAAATSGVAAREQALLDWGVESAQVGLQQVTAEGALPLEILRGKRALGYHAYSVAPLVVLAEIDARNGRRLPRSQIDALHRLVRFTLDSMDDTKLMARLAGAEQEPLGEEEPFETHDVAWLEMYEVRYPGRSGWAGRLAEMRPLGSTALGGNLTLLCRAEADDEPASPA
jgi:poly(beta-D-mannuronate) lyase